MLLSISSAQTESVQGCVYTRLHYAVVNHYILPRTPAVYIIDMSTDHHDNQKNVLLKNLGGKDMQLTLDVDVC